MMNTKVKLLLTIIWCHLLPVLSAQEMINVRHYSIEDGLSQNIVQDMLQDNDGYIWLATWNGLEKFDVFVVINLLKPEIHDQSLMPALQSVWFIPHVTVYMFSYSVLGCAFIIAVTGLFCHKEEYLQTADNLVYAGVAFLSIGMLLGSLWAKEAWGNYWSWDPKETWAVITWMGYLIYIHLRLFGRVGSKSLYVLLIFSFLALQMCWYGVNYLPAAQQSIHLYNRNN